MTHLAQYLETQKYILRSGGAIGADTAFANGTHLKEIFTADDAHHDARQMAARYHPAWERCSNYARNLHGRNCMIVLGYQLNLPVDFVICWTLKGRIQGGTGQALRIANDLGIPVLNLGSSSYESVQFDGSDEILRVIAAYRAA